ncbi:MAG: hypothetical protein ABGY96_15625 [bacterium]|nr:hypothetical protein [Gammaproteobacteria bacterium]HIL98907.1 hypothetical protein [Pseudomonadales bacterium]
MDIGEPLKNMLIAVVLMALIPLAFYSYSKTKEKVKTGFIGNSTIFIGSLFSSHHEIVKQVKATIRNKVKKTEPQEK